MGKSKSWFDFNHGWITRGDLISIQEDLMWFLPAAEPVLNLLRWWFSGISLCRCDSFDVLMWNYNVGPVVPNFTLIGPYLGLLAEKKTQKSWHLQTLSSLTGYCHARFLWNLYIYAGCFLYVCFKFGAFQLINEGLIDKNRDGANSQNFRTP